MLEVAYDLRFEVVELAPRRGNILFGHAECKIFQTYKTVIAAFQLCLEHFYKFVANIVESVVLILNVNTLFVGFRVIGNVHISKLNVKAVIEIIVKIAELLKDRLLILGTRQLIVNIVEAYSLGIIIIGYLTHAVLEYLLVRYGFLRGIRVLVIVFDLCYFLMRPLFFFLCKRLLRR